MGRQHDSDITRFSRYECKYIVDPTAIEELRAFVSPFMKLDRFSARRADARYPVCSLYLDSDDLALYQQTVNGERDRYKLRVRTYADGSDAPAFLEIKSKLNNIVRKRRTRVDRDLARRIVERRWSDAAYARLDDDTRHGVEIFADRIRRVEAKPVIRVKYGREAYESIAGDPVRITIDTELCHAVSFDGELSHEDGRWVGTPLDGPIIEIKFTDRFPTWVSDLVRMIALRQQPVPKYIMSLNHMLLSGRETPLAVAGFTLPARRG